MDAVDLLMESRPLVDKGWCQWAVARNVLGRGVEADAEDAVEWCAVGALTLVATPSGCIGFTAARDLLAEAAGVDSIIDWNNTIGRTQPEVLEVWDRAIALGLERSPA